MPPIEMRAGVGFSLGRDVGVPRDMAYRVGTLEHAREPGQNRILHGGKWHEVAALDLNADGKIVAALPPLPLRNTRMPGALSAGHKLDHIAIAPD